MVNARNIRLDAQKSQVAGMARIKGLIFVNLRWLADFCIPGDIGYSFLFILRWMK
jgi:hypothetical protein